MQLNFAQRWIAPSIFAAAMGYLEAAVVFYLRTMVGRLDPSQPAPLQKFAGLASAEILREAATLLMITTVGCMAGKTWRGKLGISLMVFGIWDITYYIFLWPLTGWPSSLFSWDILFLIPLPWWGPVWAPVSIAMLMIFFGLLATVLEQGEPPIWPDKWTAMVSAVGMAIALYVFMADAIANTRFGADAIRQTLPVHFQTPLFVCALLLMSAPVLQMGRQLATRYR